MCHLNLTFVLFEVVQPLHLLVYRVGLVIAHIFCSWRISNREYRFPLNLCFNGHSSSVKYWHAAGTGLRQLHGMYPAPRGVPMHLQRLWQWLQAHFLGRCLCGLNNIVFKVLSRNCSFKHDNFSKNPHQCHMGPLQEVGKPVCLRSPRWMKSFAHQFSCAFTNCKRICAVSFRTRPHDG